MPILNTDLPADSRNLSMPWRRVAAVLGLLLISSVTTLVIVVAIDDVDILATVALVIAILAFGAQLLGNLITTQAGSAQLLNAERVHTETSSILSEIRTHASGIAGTVENQVNMLLEYVMRPAVQDAIEESGTGAAIDPEELQNSILEKVQELLSEERQRSRRRLTIRASPGDVLDPETFDILQLSDLKRGRQVVVGKRHLPGVVTGDIHRRVGRVLRTTIRITLDNGTLCLVDYPDGVEML